MFPKLLTALAAALALLAALGCYNNNTGETVISGDIPRKGGLGITRSDLLVVNKVDLAPYVEVDLKRMAADVRAARGALPFLMTNLKAGAGVDQVAAWVQAACAGIDQRSARPAWGGPGHHHHHHHT